jgi:hypothetical protein
MVSLLLEWGSIVSSRDDGRTAHGTQEWSAEMRVRMVEEGSKSSTAPALDEQRIQASIARCHLSHCWGTAVTPMAS